MFIRDIDIYIYIILYVRVCIFARTQRRESRGGIRTAARINKGDDHIELLMFQREILFFSEDDRVYASARDFSE